MSSFRERFGNLTVKQVQELNAAARWMCDHEVTATEE